MATTQARITQQGDYFVPDKSSVPVVEGDSVTFFADPNTQTNLCMSPETAAILSPQPDLTVMIAPGESVSFQFSSGAAGAYCILTQGPDWPYPTAIDCGTGATNSAVLMISPGKPPHWSGPDEDPST
jgi:hypothetical protein